MVRTAFAAAALFLLLPTFAQAQNPGPYVEARGGAAFLTDTDFDNTGVGDVDLSFDTGWVVEGAVGYAHESGLRGEVALGYRENEFDEIEVGSVSVDVDGDIGVFTALANGYYDFHLARYGVTGAAANFAPFIGAGLGMAVIDTDGDLGDGDDTVFAYQAIGGVSYAFTDQVSLSVMYSYLGTSEFEDSGIKADYDSHNIMAGLRFSF